MVDVCCRSGSLAGGGGPVPSVSIAGMALDAASPRRIDHRALTHIHPIAHPPLGYRAYGETFAESTAS